MIDGWVGRSRAMRRIKPAKCWSGLGIGGDCPKGVEPAKVVPNSRYFGTFPDPSGDTTTVVSLFIHVDYAKMVMSSGRVVYGPSHIEAVRHAPVERGQGPRLRSAMTQCALELGRLRKDDVGRRLAGVGRPGTKIGGRPYLEEPASVSDSLGELREGGFSHFMQLEFPAEPDEFRIGGSWPFSDGTAWFFVRPPYGVKDWAYLWAI